MRARARAHLSKSRVALIVAVALMLAGPQPVLAADFTEDLARVDQALKENPAHVSPEVLQIYRTCAACHMPEGWGAGSTLIAIPQLAGQHRTVVIKRWPTSGPATGKAS